MEVRTCDCLHPNDGLLLAADRRLTVACAGGVWQSRASCSSRTACREMRCCMLVQDPFVGQLQQRKICTSTSVPHVCQRCRHAVMNRRQECKTRAGG